MTKTAKAHGVCTPAVFSCPAIELGPQGLRLKALLSVVLLAVAPSIFAATESCGLSGQGCSLVIAQADTGSPMSMQQSAQTPAPESSKSRGIFLAMLAQQLLPGATSGMDSWFKTKLNDTVSSVTGSPSNPGYQGGNTLSPGMPQQMGQQMPMQMPGMPQQMGQQMPMQMPDMPQQMGQPPPPEESSLQAGVAYQVSVVGRDGSRVLVDPTQRSFVSGERVEVQYRTNLPGLVEVFNIDPMGREERIDQKQVAAAQLAVLGPYEFVNATGSETLRINLRPCLGGAAGSNTRSMVRAQVTPELAGALIGCDDPAMRQQRVATRGIVKVAVEGGTNFALDPVSRNEIVSGQIAPREVNIRFLHR